MLAPPRIYVETSVFGFYYDTEPCNVLRRTAVVRLFDQIEAGLLVAVTSPVTEEELNRSSAELKPRLTALLRNVHGLAVDTDQVERLAAQYVSDGILPKDYMNDARHVAYAVVGEIAVLVTLNLRHLANEWSGRRINAVNLREGYSLLSIRTPEEVVRYED
jgi:predicted nucleic acid-binding protein